MAISSSIVDSWVYIHHNQVPSTLLQHPTWILKQLWNLNFNTQYKSWNKSWNLVGKFCKAYMLINGKLYKQKMNAYFFLFLQNFHQFQIGRGLIITCKKQQIPCWLAQCYLFLHQLISFHFPPLCHTKCM